MEEQKWVSNLSYNITLYDPALTSHEPSRPSEAERQSEPALVQNHRSGQRQGSS